MKAEIVDPPSSLSFDEVSIMGPIHSSSPPGRRWRVSIPVLIGMLLLAASLVGAGLSLRSHADHPSAPSPTAAPSSEDSRWNSLGNVDSEGGVTKIYPLQPGRIKSIEAKENEFVKAGEPLFHLEDTVPALKVREAEAALKVAQKQFATAQEKVKEVEKKIAAQEAAVAVAEEDAKRAQVEYDRQKRLKPDGLSDADTIKNAELLVQKAEAGIRGQRMTLAAYQQGKRVAEGYVAVAKADIEAKQSLLDEAGNAVKECVVRAPVDGTPLRLLINKGEVLGNNPHQPAIEFAAHGPLLVRAEVEQEFAGRVRKGQSVVIKDHVTEQECARGTVVSIAGWYTRRRAAAPEMPSLNNDVRTLECIIKIDPASVKREVRIGQRVRIQFPD